ncbi:MAG: hypothetical protein ACI9QL_002983 [Candidatus Omnitrophota bacterium]|jgi:hypothetical protein
MKRSHVFTLLPCGVLALLWASIFPVFAQYADWSHHGTLALLTTPDGANLPASAHEENVPVLVRLNRETFDFKHAGADGSDIRFSMEGKPLVYQIEHWDSVLGEAVIWVRIPIIRGNARHELTLHWGRSDAVSASDGHAVFNASNGYAVVMHLGDDPVKDEAGNLSPTDKGTTACPAPIGLGRRFAEGQGIACGEKITTLPTGSGPFSSSVWLKAEKVNGRVVAWGNEQAQGKAVMSVNSPPQIRLDCYFSNGNVASESPLPMGEWVHVVHTFHEGESQLYVNGKRDGHSSSKGSPLNIRTPARMWLGGWYNRFDFVGAMDEVRISRVERSADWVKLAYENQKANQTLVGTLARPGSALTVTPTRVEVDEGQRATVTAEAGGAEKVYWILKRGAEETIVASDRFSYTLDPGRITSPTAWSLQFKAIYSDRVETRNVPIAIKDAIPEPQFVLEASQAWNGRDPIEVVPRIRNLDAMKRAGADELRYRWVVSGGAVIKTVAHDRLILKRSQCSGTIQVRAYIDNGGAAVAAAVDIAVTEPATDPWVDRTPGTQEKPEQGQFYARDDQNEGTLFYNGAFDQAVDAVFLKVYADDALFTTETQQLGSGGSYAFTIKLEPGLIKYRVEFGTMSSGQEKVLERVGNLVCGDAYLIDGQSNALATDTGEDAPRVTSEWIRSYGGPTGRGDGAAWVEGRMKKALEAGEARPNLWCSPVWKKNAPEQEAQLGWWAMELAKGLVERQQVPVCIIQAAIGGSRIDEHQPTPGDHADLTTMYGRMLWRLQEARLTDSIRAVLWHQGENDQGAAGPTGGYGWESYQDFFVEMAAAWKEDLPNVRQYYVFQIWPNACSMGGREGSGDRLREAQRTLPQLFSNLSILSTLGIKPPGGCHFPLEGWGAFAELVRPMIERDVYHAVPEGSISPPNLLQARFTGEQRNVVALEFDQPVVWHDALVREFYLDDESGAVVSGAVSGKVITLQLKAPSTATTITYLRERDWSQDRLILGANGLAALSFCEVSLAGAATQPE